MWIKRKVVMLPTNEKADLQRWGNWLFFDKSQKLSDREPKVVFQHLYILSDEEIKESDWCINPSTRLPFQVRAIQRNRLVYSEGSKKIIASTNTSLGIQTYNSQDGTKSYISQFPQPSQRFIEKYVEEYNKGNIITDVMVEYQQYDANPRAADWKEQYVKYMLEHKENLQWRLKVDKDNTIAVRKVKGSWNREELIIILNKFHSDLISGKINRLNDNWIEQNL